MLLAIAIADFCLYWPHRLSHIWTLLWRLHAVHHSTPRLYFSSTARFHPLEVALSNLVGFVPLIALGADHCPFPSALDVRSCPQRGSRSISKPSIHLPARTNTYTAK
ncbi:MAG: hypothetical protein GKR94_05740 [Gammaproteobacteria bacterium]|nr:hypothetical protein [Gammaproteobacteria bacterium]